jgi:glycosyltransferase involved in cell wall biosynthesis
MKIWLVSVYGSVPSDGWRGYRPHVMGEVLSELGHQVIWWVANFSHHLKSYRSQGWGRIEVNPNFDIRLVPTTSYRRNISLARLWFELVFAWRLYRRARVEPPPDVILATEPPQSNAFVAARLARRFSVPLVVDVCDLWPEWFAMALPGWARPVAPVLFSPFAALRRMNFRSAQGVTAVSDTYLELARREAPGLPAERYVTAYTGCDMAGAWQQHLDAEQLQELALRLHKPPGQTWAIYAGGLSDNYDISTLLEASARLAELRSPVRILMAGAGPRAREVVKFQRESPAGNLSFVGKLDPEELSELYQLCDMAIAAYAPGSTVSMPTKIFDYLGAGLPIVNSLRGECQEFLERYGLGRPYTAGDPASLAEALSRLAGEPGARAEMSANCLRLAPEFDSRRQYAKIGRLLEALRPAPTAGVSPDAALSLSGS